MGLVSAVLKSCQGAPTRKVAAEHARPSEKVFDARVVSARLEIRGQ